MTDLEPAFTDLSEADLNSYVKLKHLWDGTAIPAIARLNRGEEGLGFSGPDDSGKRSSGT